MPRVNQRHWDWETIVGGACKASASKWEGCATGKGTTERPLPAGTVRPDSRNCRKVQNGQRLSFESLCQFQTLGMVTLLGDYSAIVPYPQRERDAGSL